VEGTCTRERSVFAFGVPVIYLPPSSFPQARAGDGFLNPHSSSSVQASSAEASFEHHRHRSEAALDYRGKLGTARTSRTATTFSQTRGRLDRYFREPSWVSRWTSFTSTINFSDYLRPIDMIMNQKTPSALSENVLQRVAVYRSPMLFDNLGQPGVVRFARYSQT